MFSLFASFFKKKEVKKVPEYIRIRVEGKIENGKAEAIEVARKALFRAGYRVLVSHDYTEEAFQHVLENFHDSKETIIIEVIQLH